MAIDKARQIHPMSACSKANKRIAPVRGGVLVLIKVCKLKSRQAAKDGGAMSGRVAKAERPSR